MIVKGKSRAGPGALAAHLGNAEKNERVTLLETKGTVAQDLRGALVEMDAYALGTRCEKSLYHAAMSPEPPHRLSPEQRIEAIDALEEKLGLTGHSRVVVMHEKLGREHIHIVWSRIDLDQMKSVSDSHNYRKHEEVSRDLERRFGHERVQGAHAEREGVERPERTPSRAELRQEERTGIKGKMVTAAVTEIFKASDNAQAFHAALHERDYILAKGDRRDFVIVDRAGGIHSLTRRIEGMKAAELREFMAPIDREKLPSTEEAREIAEERERRRQEAKLEASYSRGEDYVTQSQTALKDHARRQEDLNEMAGRDTAWHRIESGEKARDSRTPEVTEGSAGKSEDEERIARLLDEHHSERAQEGDEISSTQSKGNERVTSKFDNVEMTEAQQQRMKRLIDTPEKERDYDEHYERDPDRQHEAPGGGRTRSR
ncbi:MAG: relaxase/mobilization nuclease domain-containing protein [Proteobacteria bacterium]|nr:relaxase/mobilization nuclease domain-containing protein [Pseudomonadota bacterium]